MDKFQEQVAKKIIGKNVVCTSSFKSINKNANINLPIINNEYEILDVKIFGKKTLIKINDNTWIYWSTDRFKIYINEDYKLISNYMLLLNNLNKIIFN